MTDYFILKLAACLAVLVVASGCILDKQNAPSGPFRQADYSLTPHGHSRTGGVSDDLDKAVDLGFSKFHELFPELLTRINTVVVKPGVFYLDGDWCSGSYLDGTDFIVVSSGSLKAMGEQYIPHELLHTVIGDPDHHASQYWNRIHAEGVFVLE